MLRECSLDIYGEEVCNAFNHFYKEAFSQALDYGDFLVCQQGGFLYDGKPAIGMGEVGVNNIPKLNIIEKIGPSIFTTKENYYRDISSCHFDGTSNFEKNIMRVCNLYLDIWENEYFLRTFAEIIRVANGEHYDWELDLSKKSENGKRKFIVEQIIGKLNPQSPLKEIVKFGYNSNLRNAIAHSQYHIIAQGICLDNFGRNKYCTLRAITFEEWEKMVIYSWLIIKTLFSSLLQINLDQFFKLSKSKYNGRIPILIPQHDNKWKHQYIYPSSEDGRFWRF